MAGPIKKNMAVLDFRLESMPRVVDKLTTRSAQNPSMLGTSDCCLGVVQVNQSMVSSSGKPTDELSQAR